MKNQYFGDVRDWLKYAMLRRVLRQGVTLTVGWMLTPDDGGPDGELRQFAQKESNRELDPQLFSWIGEWIQRGGPRDVREIESSSLLEGARFHTDILADQMDARDEWFTELRRIASGTDVVFLDPDNGLEIKSCRRGARRSSKFVYWSDVDSLLRAGWSVIVYQHLPRVPHADYVRGRLAEASARLEGTRRCFVLARGGVDYFCFPQPQHEAALERAFRELARAEGGFRFVAYDLTDGGAPDTPALPVYGAATRVDEKKRERRSGNSTTTGAVNRNEQIVLGPSDAAPSLHGQRVYTMRCGRCDHRYGANGCDVFQRKCPNCQGGAAGIRV